MLGRRVVCPIGPVNQRDYIVDCRILELVYEREIKRFRWNPPMMMWRNAAGWPAAKLQKFSTFTSTFKLLKNYFNGDDGKEFHFPFWT